MSDSSTQKWEHATLSTTAAAPPIQLKANPQSKGLTIPNMSKMKSTTYCIAVFSTVTLFSCKYSVQGDVLWRAEFDSFNTLIPCQTWRVHVTSSLFGAVLEKLGSAEPCLVNQKKVFFSSPQAVPPCRRNCGSLHVSEDIIKLTVELQDANYYWLKTMMKSYFAMCSTSVASDQP